MDGMGAMQEPMEKKICSVFAKKLVGCNDYMVCGYTYDIIFKEFQFSDVVTIAAYTVMCYNYLPLHWI